MTTLTELQNKITALQAELEAMKAKKTWPNPGDIVFSTDLEGDVQKAHFMKGFQAHRFSRTEAEAIRRRDRAALVAELRERAGHYQPVWDNITIHWYLWFSCETKKWGWFSASYTDVLPLSGYFPKADQSIIDDFADRLFLLRDVQS